MKRYISILAAMLFAAAFFSCTTAELEEDSPVLTDIEIVYMLDGEEVKSLPFNSSSRSVTVDVTLNNQNIYWDMESDSDWCAVLDEEHRGSGSFTLNITANEEFEEREPATLTFVSGQYRGREIKVSQDGNVFIVDCVYAAGSKLAGSADIEVAVQEGVEWSIVEQDWLKASKGEESSADGMVTTKVHISWDENASGARYGSIGFLKEGGAEPDSQFSVFQFGNELDYDARNNIFLPAKDAPAVELKVPMNSIETVTCPEWITYTTKDNKEDNTTSYMIVTDDNPSDTRTVRESDISLKIRDKVTEVAVPVFRQDYYTVSGIISADGLKLFAQTVNAGGDVSEWQKDGNVVLLNNIDMSFLTGEWIPIGTEDSPFSGTFDGQYRKIMNMTSSEPLFGRCEGAAISNVIIDESSKFETTAEYISECTLAALAGVLTDCSVSECSNYASVTMNAASGNAKTSSWTAGLIGRVEEGTTVSKCENYGTVKIGGESLTAYVKDEEACISYVGGIAAVNNGTITESVNNGPVSDAGAALDHYIGGVAGLSAGVVSSCSNKGTVTVSSFRTVNGNLDHSRWIYMGGIAGRMNEGEIVSSVNAAPLVSDSDVKMQKIGGVAGYISDESPVLKDNTNSEEGSVTLNGKDTDYIGGRAVAAGGLYGEITVPLTLDFSTDAGVSKGAIICNKLEPSPTTSNVHLGGLVGCASKDITIISPDWASSIGLNFAKTNVGSLIFGVGGIIGSALETLTISDAASHGDISLTTASGYALNNKTAGLGGVAGYAGKGAVLQNCTNDTPVLQVVYNKKSNSYQSNFGGIIGVIVSGDSEISGCVNNGAIDNEHYNNNNYTVACNSSGGIIGAFSYPTSSTGALVIRNCSNTASVKSRRGMTGGIIGYGRNTTVSDCENTGSLANGERSYVGGIAGVLAASSVGNSTALCPVAGSTAGSEKYNCGGIAGIIGNGTALSGCSYFGSISYTPSATTPEIQDDNYAGAVVGNVLDTESSVAGCRVGGTVLETELLESNFASFICGYASITPAGCTYWNGK